MHSELPSIAFFAYKRPQHTERTIRSLLRCKGADDFRLHIFCDGAKTEKDEPFVSETRTILKSLLGTRATYSFRETNAGLARSVIAGVSELVSTSGSVIVVEDDLELHPRFLEFMQGALTTYRDNEKIMQVSGFLLPTDNLISTSTCNFLPFTSSWGWATWERAWRMFDEKAMGWEALSTDTALKNKFNLENTLDYSTMLRDQMEGKIDSWAIRWYWSVFKNDGLVAYPPVNLVTNHGFDGSGTHGRWLAKRITKSQPLVSNQSITFPPVPEFSGSLYHSIVCRLKRHASIRSRFFFRLPYKALLLAITSVKKFTSRGR